MKQFRKVAIADITIGDRKRSLGDVESLADSMKTLGQLQPVVVTDDMRLVAGRRRIAAASKLGWDEINANVMTLDDLQREVAEIDENLVREELTVLERSRQLARRKEIYEAQHPETKNGATGRGRNRSADSAKLSFADEAATKTSRSSRVVREEVQIAESITDEAQEIIESTDIADSKTELLNLARVPEEKQVSVAEKIKAGEASTVAQAKRLVEREEKKETMKSKAAAAPESSDAWEIITGDCVPTLKTIKRGSVRLAFADPPYNIGIDYGGGKKADLLPADEYMDWCAQWMQCVADLLTADGSFWVLINDEWAEHFALALTATGLVRRQWLIWYESFGVNNANGFNRCSRHLFWYVKNPKRFVFNEDAVLRPSDRQEKYGDKRAQPGGKSWDSVWGVNPPIPRVVDNAKERMPDFPTQLPLALLTPIIGVASDPGDKVLDPFNGSGTTGAAALTLGREYIGIERNEDFAEAARLRLRSISVEV